jgi:hypothetical protein
VAFRDTAGEVGLLPVNCPHRGASLFFGPERGRWAPLLLSRLEMGCPGRCVDMPNEPEESTFKDKVRARAYPCRDVNGVIWTYLGPRETPPAFSRLRDQHPARGPGLPAAHDAGGVQLGAGARGRHRLLPYRFRPRQAQSREQAAGHVSPGQAATAGSAAHGLRRRAIRPGGAPMSRDSTGTASPSSSCPSTR